MREPNGKYYRILDDYQVQFWLVFFQIEKGIYRNLLSKRGTFPEVNNLADAIKNHRGFLSYHMRLGQEPRDDRSIH